MTVKGSWQECGSCGGKSSSATLTIKGIKTYVCDNCWERHTGEHYYNPKPNTRRGKKHKTCALCGKEFVTPYSRKIFCSKECQEQSRRRTKKV